MKLTDDAIASLRCPEGRKDMLVFDDAVKGFGVRVQAKGPPVFLFRYKLAGLSRRVPLGAFGEVTTAKARREAERLRGEVLAGRDPWGERKNDAAALVKAERAERARRAEEAFTVKALIDLYEAKHVSGLRPATQRDVMSRLRLHLSGIEARPATEIGRKDAARIVDLAAGAGATTARRVRDYARAMWTWAQRRGTLSDDHLNPWLSAPAPGRDVPRERVLTSEELGLIWRASEALASPYGPLVRFLMLTLARREEVAAMAWGEVAPDLSVWTQPGARTKNGKAHVVHLCEPARQILRDMVGAEHGKPLPALPKGDRLVFAVPGGKAMSSHSWVKRSLDKAIAAARSKAAMDASKPPPEAMPGWVFHDFRRSGVTWLSGAGFPPHVADRLLNHLQGTIRGVAAVYQRGDFAAERMAALDAWGEHLLLCAAVGRTTVNNVTELAPRRRRAKA